MVLALCVSSWCLWVHSLVLNTSISVKKKNWSSVMLILRYLPHASVVKLTTTGISPSSLIIENIVLSVLLERRSELWTERLRAGMFTWNVITTLPTHHPWGMSSTTKGLVLPFHPYHPLASAESPSSSIGLPPSLVSHVRSPLLTLHWEVSLKPGRLGCVQM